MSDQGTVALSFRADRVSSYKREQAYTRLWMISFVIIALICLGYPLWVFFQLRAGGLPHSAGIYAVSLIPTFLACAGMFYVYLDGRRSKRKHMKDAVLLRQIIDNNRL